MATIQWDAVGSRFYETGVDRCVLYEPDGVGVPWNGVTAVEEENNNEVEAVYYDGVKFNDLVTIGEFNGVLRAFTYPEEFLKYDGIGEDHLGILLANQPPQRFHLSYRTRIGDDVNGIQEGYKIHLLYNLTANAATKNWETMGLELNPMEFEWAITGIPEEVQGLRPTSHVIIDTRKIDPWLLEDLEGILYGTSETEPHLPSLRTLLTFIRNWSRVIIIDNGDGTWTAHVIEPEGEIDFGPDGYFEMTLPDENVTVLDSDTYELTSSPNYI